MQLQKAFTLYEFTLERSLERMCDQSFDFTREDCDSFAIKVTGDLGNSRFHQFRRLGGIHLYELSSAIVFPHGKSSVADIGSNGPTRGIDVIGQPERYFETAHNAPQM
jgi:hypothetical protein